MKKKLFSVIAGLCMFSFMLTANAEEVPSASIDSVESGSNSTNAAVTVGNVEAPVYGVAVIWNDLTFDWVYDADADEYGWKPADMCSPLSTAKEDVEEALAMGAKVYSDNTCSNRVYEYSGSSIAEYYYLVEREEAYIGIEDLSENAQIVPSVSWTATQQYGDVNANFQYYGKTCISITSQDVFSAATSYYSDADCTSKTTASTYVGGQYYTYAYKKTALTGEEIPDNARMNAAGTGITGGMLFPAEGYLDNQYRVLFTLEGGNNVPTKGETIGTITVSIRAK